MPELGTSGSVRGVCSNAHPYRDNHAPRLMQHLLAGPLRHPDGAEQARETPIGFGGGDCFSQEKEPSCCDDDHLRIASIA
jgi:hypothetical protein